VAIVLLLLVSVYLCLRRRRPFHIMSRLAIWSPRVKVVARFVADGWKFYLRKLDEKPIVTLTLSTAGLFTAGDIFAQNLVEKRYTHAPWDITRTIRVGAVGLLFMGPSYAVWYRGLDKLIIGSGVKQTIGKVALDQGIMAWVFCAWFVMANAVLSGHSLDDAWGEWTTHRRDIMEANYKLWPAAQLLNFSLVPSAHRVLFVNLVSIGWNTFLAWKSHRTPRDSPAPVPTVPQSQSVNDNSNNNQNPQKTAQQLQCIVCKASTKDP